MITLSIDVGNTRIKMGIFKGSTLVEKIIWQAWNMDLLQLLLQKQQIKRIILTNSGEFPEEVKNFLKNNYFCVHLDEHTPIPIQNHYATPKTLGKDRLAAIVGAFSLFPRQACLVIDTGTCITYNVLTAKGVFLGGNITPGVKMRLKAMHTFTARLPLVEQVDVFEKTIGDSTVSAMQIGGGFGAIVEMQGFIRYFKKRFRHLNVILTGGDALFFQKNLDASVRVEPDLVLIGLNQILNYNVL